MSYRNQHEPFDLHVSGPNELGFIVMNDKGMILESGGDLSKNEKMAKLLLSIVKTVNLLKDGDEHSSSKMVKIQFDTHFYALVASTSTRITVLKNKVCDVGDIG